MNSVDVKRVITSVVALVIALAMVGCSKQNQYAFYHSENGLVDRLMRYSYEIESDRGEVLLSFKEKNIPQEIAIKVGAGETRFTYRSSGSLKAGRIHLRLIRVGGDSQELVNYPKGNLAAKGILDLTPGRYKLKLDFDDARGGKYKLTYSLNEAI